MKPPVVVPTWPHYRRLRNFGDMITMVVRRRSIDCWLGDAFRVDLTWFRFRFQHPKRTIAIAYLGRVPR